MNRIYTLVISIVVVLASYAQLPVEGDYRVRLGTIDQEKALMLFNSIYGNDDSPLKASNAERNLPIDIPFYIDFKQLTTLAPYADYDFYSGRLYEEDLPIPSMYKRMLDSITDPAIRVMLVEDVVEHGNIYVDHMDSINVLRELNTATKGDPLTMPLAKIKRAHYNYMYAHNPQYYPPHLYDKERAYRLYREAFQEFLSAKGDQGKELHAFYVREYYRVCEDLYRSNEEKYYEQFLGDYLEIVDVCDKLLVPYYDVPDSIKMRSTDPEYVQYRNYNAATNGIEIKFRGDTIINGRYYEFNDTIPTGVKWLFYYSGAANPERLKSYYGARLEANRNNKEFLDRAIQFMFDNGLKLDSVVYEYSKASYELGKTYNNCLGLAFSAYIGLIPMEDMRLYYMDALDMSTSALDKARIHYLIAVSLYTPLPSGVTLSSPRFLQWVDDITACNQNLNDLLSASDVLLASSNLADRGYVAQAYYMLGENHYQLSFAYQKSDIINEALNNFYEAGRRNLSAENGINGRSVNLQKRIEDALGRKEKIREQEIKDRVNKRRQEEYEAYMRKKAAEEAFWNQGK